MHRDIGRHSTSGIRHSGFDIRTLSFCLLYLLSPISYLLSPICVSAGSSAEARLALAASLLETGDNARAALEYRRLAADLEPDDPSLPGLYLAAADAYRRDGAWERMTKVLDHAEDAGAGGTPQLLLLRAEQAEGAQDWVSAGDYAAELAQAAAGNARLAAWARGTAAANYLRSHGTDDARGAVAGDSAREAALDRYLAGHDKSPTVGGLLGIVPGLGYAYSGEWGNMFRSLFLNGLFAVTTFFELTWYTGSIYGGIDAAHRYNRRRLDDAVRELRGDEAPALRPGGRVDLFSLHLDF